MKEWNRKDTWKRMGKNFLVKIDRHNVEIPSDLPMCFDSEGGNRWCVYAYIYPKHPLFSKIEPDGGMFQDSTSNLPLHCGASYFEPHYYLNHESKKVELTSFQIGADYNHLHDTHYTRMETREEAYQVFADAEELFDYLSTTANPLLDKTGKS